MTSFELDRRSGAGSAVAPPGVIEHLDAVENISESIAAIGVGLATNTLALEQLKEAYPGRRRHSAISSASGTRLASM